MISVTSEQHVLTLKMPYNQDFVSELKETIPAHMRQWDPDSKVWYVGLPYLGALVRILEGYFSDSEILLDHDIPNLIALRDVIEPKHSPYSELYLLPDAPKEVCYAAYRALAKLFHPDVNGGDSKRMKRINLAWEAVK